MDYAILCMRIIITMNLDVHVRCPIELDVMSPGMHNCGTKRGNQKSKRTKERMQG